MENDNNDNLEPDHFCGELVPVEDSIKKVSLTVTLPEATLAKLEAYARRKGLYKSQVVRNLIEEYL